jgi:hypothetical protein
MKTNVTTVQSNPTATLAINKGRVKIYNKKSTPTYYLQKGQEFQIEIFNPTTDKILAKIKLNNTLISQGGLVLRPGERVFLDRFFDIDKKFKFDTYEVSGGNEVKQAIRDNGDVEIMFYREQQVNYNNWNLTIGNTGGTLGGPHTTFYNAGAIGGWAGGTTTDGVTFDCCSSSISDNISTVTANLSTSTLDFGGNADVTHSTRSRGLVGATNPIKKLKVKKTSRKIETGRVEEGAKSDQKFKTVDIDFETYPFHRVSYKLLPISQQNVESQDLHKSYCSNCGAKAKAKDNFCSKCGRKV